jgi:PAS domain S-box-containing protein
MVIKFPLKCKILSLILLHIFALGGYAWHHYAELVEHETSHAKTLNREITADGARMFDDIVDRTFSLLRGLARHPAVINHDIRSAHRLLAEVLAGERHLLNIIAVDRDGRIFGNASDQEGAQRLNDGDSWFPEALKRPVVGDFHISRLSNTPTIMVAMPVRDSEGKVVGAIAAPLFLEYAGRAVTRGLLLQDRAFLQIINAEGTVILDTSGRPAGRSVQYPAASPDGEIIDQSGGNTKHITMVMPLMHGGLRAVVGMPVEDVYRDAQAFGKRFVVVFLAMAIASLAVGLFVAVRIGRRLAEVIDGMREMERGNLTARIRSEGSDELHAIAEQFNAMADARNRSDEKIRRHLDMETAFNKTLRQSVDDAPLEKILQSTLESILSFPWLKIEAGGGIFLSDPSGDLLLTAERGLSADVRQECFRVSPGRCLCGRAAREQRILFADTIDERHDVHYAGMQPHSHYCVPILFKDATLGVIVLYLKEGHARNESEEQLLQTIAGSLAGIIQRKRMQEERERLVQGLQNLVRQVTRAKREWQATFDAITDPVSIHDKDFRVIRANKAFAEHVGLKPEEIPLRKCYEMMHHTSYPLACCPHKMTLEDAKPHAEEVLDPRTGRTFGVSTFPYFTEEGEFIGSVHIAKDITEKREQEKLLAVSERFAGLGRMASGIAHEINNPLAAISGSAEGLLTRIGSDRYEPEFFRRYLGIIQTEVFRCKNITTSMLSFVRQSGSEKGYVEVNQLLEESLQDIDTVQGRLRGVEVRKSYGEAIPPVQADEGELRRALLIIINNALDAMNGSGMLTLESGFRNGEAMIRISDTGPGIPEEHRHRIFDPFFTTKQSTGGTGLGLSLARKIVTNHNGSIGVACVPDHGTAFTVVLPCSTA